MRILTILAVALLLAVPAAARDSMTAEKEAVQAVIDATYETISGPAGKARDFHRLHDFFLPGAVLGRVDPGEDGSGKGRTLSLDEFIESAGPEIVKSGFTEVGTRTEIRIYGELATARAAYKGTETATGEVRATGVNFFTLFKVNGKWRVASLLWRHADEDWPVERAFE